MKTLVAAILLLGLLGGEARGDRRLFTFLYQPVTMPKGGLELEWYMTGAVTRDKISGSHSFGWKHQVELEYGITDVWDVSMYQVFSPTSWDGYKLRTRYRPLADRALPVELMLYFEFIHLRSGDVELEQKIVVGRQFGPVVISLDSTVEEGPLGKSVTLQWAEGLGVAVQIRPWVALGLENQLRMSWAREVIYGASRVSYSGATYYVGPTVSFAAGKMWWDLNVSFKGAGSEDQARYLFRVLWGVDL